MYEYYYSFQYIVCTIYIKQKDLNIRLYYYTNMTTNLRIKDVRNMMLNQNISFEVLTAKDFMDFYSDTDEHKTTIYHDIETDIYYILGEDLFIYYKGDVTD